MKIILIPIIVLALGGCAFLKDLHKYVPDRLVPDGNGGYWIIKAK